MLLLANKLALIPVESQERVSIMEGAWSTEKGNEGGKRSPETAT